MTGINIGGVASAPVPMVPFQVEDFNVGWQQIWAVPAAGGTAVPVTTQTTTYDFDPDVSPDGTKIAFLRQVTGPGDPTRLFFVNADGSGEAQLDSTNDATAPMWSPDGTKILYRVSGGVFTIEPDGSNKTDVSPDAAPPGYPVGWDGIRHPTWNSDGGFYAFQYDASNALTLDELWVCEADGANAVKLSDATRGGLGGLGISWQHGADTMAFIERVSSNNQVSTIDADGTNKTQRTTSAISPALSKYGWADDDISIIVPQADASPWTIYAVDGAATGQAALSPTLDASANVAEGIPRNQFGRFYVVRTTTGDLVSVLADGSDLRVEYTPTADQTVSLTGNGTEL